LNPEFRDLFVALAEAGADYLVIGGHALAFHDQPRFTKDLDIWVRPSPENARRVANALAAFGVPPRQLREDLLATPDVFFKIGEPPARIDLLTGIDGVGFDEAWTERIEGEYGGQRVHVISRRHLIANKRASGRPQDLLDADALEAAG
jgi:hypothetical protein